MCTVVILRRPDHAWPLILAANRDEMLNRPWRPPARHWPDREDVVAGLDETAGGTWLGLNDHGVVAAILNRRGSLGPAPGMRTRGELVLEALDHADAASAATALADLAAASYRPFNMVVADNRDAFWLANRDQREVAVTEIPVGTSLLTAWDLNDTESGRIERFLPLFRDAAPPDPETGEWQDWVVLMSGRDGGGDDDNREFSMNVVTDFGFGTSSSSLIALPAPAATPIDPVWLFAAGRPDEAPFEPVQ
ncbi:MAG: NRDE family protein [Alphaproteobacteria bacterium]|nr:NRDE family protein [Alphaproteobacteria bacterium]